MKSFTIEWNAVITLENEGRPGREALVDLVSLHPETIDLGIATTAASENTRLREMPVNTNDFERRLEEVGLGNLSRVPTIGVFGLSYYGYARFASPVVKETVMEIWEILPNAIPMNHLEFGEDNGIPADTPISSDAYWRWRNKFCDVYSLEAHIAAGRDVYVTGDLKNFRGYRRDAIIALGAGEICSYAEAFDIAKMV